MDTTKPVTLVSCGMRYGLPECRHPECIQKRIEWYAEATGVSAPVHIATALRGRVVRRGRMASARKRAPWEDQIRQMFGTTCGVCNTSGYHRMPMLVTCWWPSAPTKVTARMWIGPDRKRQGLCGYVIGADAPVLARLDKPYTWRCVCGRVLYSRSSALPVVPRLPERLPKSTHLGYWWARRALIDRPVAALEVSPRKVDQSISTFYVLEALRHEPTLVAMAIRSVAAQRVIEELQAQHAAYTVGLAKDLMVYLRYAVASELRHTDREPEHWKNTVHHDCQCVGHCPECAWLDAYQGGNYKRTQDAVDAWPGTAEEYWAYADHVFHFVHWNSGFGGQAWGTITTAAGEYESGASTAAQFVDRAFNLQHNGGLCFDKKPELVSYGQADPMKLLDIKRQAKDIVGLVPLIRHVPSEYHGVVERALTLLMVQGGRYAKGLS